MIGGQKNIHFKQPKHVHIGPLNYCKICLSQHSTLGKGNNPIKARQEICMRHSDVPTAYCIHIRI